MSLSKLKPHHINKFWEERRRVVSAGTVLKDLGLLSAVINTGTTEWGLENVLRSNPVSLISKPRAPRPRDRRLEEGDLDRLLSACTNTNSWFRLAMLFAIEAGMFSSHLKRWSCWEVCVETSALIRRSSRCTSNR